MRLKRIQWVLCAALCLALCASLLPGAAEEPEPFPRASLPQAACAFAALCPAPCDLLTPGASGAAEEPPPSPERAACAFAALRPAPSDRGLPSESAHPLPVSRASIVPPALRAAPARPAPSRIRDANGRVIARGAYVRSVYPLFRPEIAAG